MEIVMSILSILLSGIIANVISNNHTKKYQEKQIKLQLLDDLFGYRYQMSDGYTGQKAEINRALNRIPIVFAGNPDVVEAFNQFYNATQSVSNNRDQIVVDKLITLLKKICIVVEINSTNWNDSYIKNMIIIK